MVASKQGYDLKFRIISRLDVKSEFLIKGVRFEGLRKIGNPAEVAATYFNQGIDEILLVDNVASLYGRNHLGPLLEEVAKNAFVPLTAAGGIRSEHDAESLFGLGADKVAINTASFSDTELVAKIAGKYGSQAIVGSIQAKRVNSGWECLVEQGRERTGVELVERIHTLIDMGVGEILVTSVDNDGVQLGFDKALAEIAVASSSVPVVIGGGCGSTEDVKDLLAFTTPSGVAIGSALHFGKFSVGVLKSELLDSNFI